ncbi:MAG: RsmE family RNA methyltransferase [Spirochaetaceae bacterium]
MRKWRDSSIVAPDRERRIGSRMNRMLFEAHELDGRVLSFNGHDRRTKHIRSILRLEPGDTLRAGIVNGPPGTVTLESVGENGVSGTFVPDTPSDAPQAGIGGTLLLAAVRPIVFKRLIKDLATLGLDRVFVCASDLTEKSYLSASVWTSDALRERLVAGAEQGGLTSIPEVRVFHSVRSAMEHIPAGTRVLADQDGASPAELLRDYSPWTPEWTAAVGPERGFTEQERDTFLNAGFIAVSLGPSVLRSETAAQTLPLVVYALCRNSCQPF